MKSPITRITQPVALALSVVILTNWVAAFPDLAARQRVSRLSVNRAATSTRSLATTSTSAPEQPAAPEQARVTEAFGKLPLSFEANRGQRDAAVKFTARNGSMSVFLLDSGEAVFQLRNADRGLRNEKADRSASASDNPQSAIRNPQLKESAVVRMKLAGAKAAPRVVGAEPLAGTTNYFIGNDPAKWRTDVPTYGKVKYEGVYPGIDLIYYGNQRQLEYDFVVAPGSDPARIKLRFNGASKLQIDEGGDLIIRGAGGGEMRMRAPVSYQETNGVKKIIGSRYTLKGQRQVGFQLAKYDRSLPLVIDPVIVYSTYLGGIGQEIGFGIALDPAGNAYITGRVVSSDNFPTVNPFQATHGGGANDAFITKFNAAGNALVYSTYLGGSGFDNGESIAVDSSGNAYVTGNAGSNFPTMNPFQTLEVGGFVTKLNAAGNALVYSTYLGGNGQTSGLDIAVDAAGSAYVTGRTNARNFPTANPLQPTHGGFDFDAFVTKFNAAGSALVYSTYLGGNGTDEGYGIAVDSSGNAYVTGRVFSTNFPVVNPFQSSRRDSGFGDAFVTKLNVAGNALAYSTFLGGGRTDEGSDIAVDSSGNAYVTGYTGSADFPVANPFQATNGNPNLSNDPDAFVTKLSAAGNALVYSTYLGGSDRDFGFGIAVDAAGNTVVMGSTRSSNFPLQDPLPGTGPSDGFSAAAFATKLNSSGQALVYSSYLNEPNGRSEGYGVAVDAAGSAYLTGLVSSSGFPTVNPFQATFGGFQDAFVMKIGSAVVPPGEGTLSISPNKGGDTGAASVTLRFSNGAAFQQGATLKLARAGQPDIVASLVSVGNQGRTMGGVLDLRGRARGFWNVVVTNPDNTTTTLAEGFTIEQGREPDVFAELNGRTTIRQSRRQTFTVTVGNRGNIDAYAVPLTISFPSYLIFRPDFNIRNPAQPPDLPPIDFSQVPLTVQRGSETLVPLVIPILRPNTPRFIRFSLEVPAEPDRLGMEFQVRVRADKPMVELSPVSSSPNLLNSVSAPAPTGYAANTAGIELPTYQFSPSNACLRDLIDIVFGIVGVAIPFSCANAIAAQVLNAEATVIVAEAVDLGSGGSERETVASFNGLLVPGALTLLGCIPGLGQIFSAIQLALAIYNALNDCFKQVPEPEPEITVRIIGAFDPNAKIGAQGVGTSRFISGDTPVPYTIYFENVETATAPAQDVVITDQLDVANFDLSTFGFGPIAFGTRLVTPPPNLKEFATDVDLRPANNLIVRVDARLDTTTGALRWTFTSLDPATGMPTEDPTAGFLPPNRTPPEGDGNVLFTVKPKPELATGTEVRNLARIVFDTNAPIDTPVWLNTIDNTPPVSRVEALAAQQTAFSFTVNWSGMDAGSGIQDYTIFVSTNGGAFAPWLVNTTETSAVFPGQPSTTYAFYSLARDLTGNREATKTAAEATTRTPASTEVTGSVRATRSGLAFSRVSRQFVGTVTMTNTGGSNIAGPLQLVFDNLTPNVTLANASGSTPPSELPGAGAPFITINSGLAPGQAVTVQVRFNNPSNGFINYTPRVFSGSFSGGVAALDKRNQ